MLTNPLIATPSRLPTLGAHAASLSPNPLPAPEGRAFALTDKRVEISPPALSRQATILDGMTAETVQALGSARFEARFRGPVHLLVVHDQAASRGSARRLIFVPAGHEYHEIMDTQASARLMYVYVDPAGVDLIPRPDLATAASPPFDDPTLLETALKLKRSLENAVSEDHPYLQALGSVLLHELARSIRHAAQSEPAMRGGLAAWQRRAVTAYIDEHLGEAIPLAVLARLAQLSPWYFCRAFKQSFGVSPGRYHTARRIEHAKAKLATRSQSVTDIGLAVGYSETSSFTAAFRKATGLTPSAYQRNLIG